MKVILKSALFILIVFNLNLELNALSPFNGARTKTSTHNVQGRFATAPNIRYSGAASNQNGFETVYQWKFLDFQYPDLATRHAALENG